jgi:hypothetical protein
VVERRQASALRFSARAASADADRLHASVGVLPPFSVSFVVIAGLDPAIHANVKLDRICR